MRISQDKLFHDGPARSSGHPLDKLSEFPATYPGIRTGFTVLKGKVHSKVTNDKDLVLYLTGHSTGLASSTGASKVVIKMKD